MTDEPTTTEQPTDETTDEQQPRQPFYRDPVWLAGAALTVGVLVWYATRPKKEPAQIVMLQRPCKNCGKKENAYAYVRPESGDDVADPVVAPVDPQKVVVGESGDSGLDGAGIDGATDLGEALGYIPVTVAEHENV